MDLARRPPASGLGDGPRVRILLLAVFLCKGLHCYREHTTLSFPQHRRFYALRDERQLWFFVQGAGEEE